MLLGGVWYGYLMHTTTDLRSALDVLSSMPDDFVAFHVTLSASADADEVEVHCCPSVSVVPGFDASSAWLVGDADNVQMDVVDLLRRDLFLLDGCSEAKSFGDCSALARTFWSLV